MKVNFYATLRQIVGQKSADINLESGSSVQNLLDKILELYPPLRRELLDEQGQLYPHVHIFVNGRDAPYLDKGMQTVLQPEDKLDIFPAVGGG